MPRKTYDFIVIGAGIIGLATAYVLKKRHPDSTLLILEKEISPGLHASGRNSGVLHSGIYYSPETLKAKVCSRGGAKMRDFAEEHQIPCKKLGKVIVATDDIDLPVIETLMANAKGNGVRAEKLVADEIKKIEPHCNPHKVGIYCPDTAVIDSKSVVKKLYDILSSKGVTVHFTQKAIDADPNTSEVVTPDNRYSYGQLYNCAGAYADILGKKFGVGGDYGFLPFKGIYFQLKPEKRDLVIGNIYPVPDIRFPFLGVHFSRSIGGGAYVGPTAIPAFGRENYGIIKDINIPEAFTVGRRLASVYLSNEQNFRLLARQEIAKYFKINFLKAARALVPSVNGEDLIRSDKVGIRPQLVNIKKKRLELDYVVERTDRSTHVLNAISPAFTSSLEFAELVVGEA